MKMKENEDFVLVGHLQVLDEALSSLYTERVSGRYFLFVRIYEDNDDDTFVLAQVRPSTVIDYIDGKVGLKRIFALSPSFYYKHRGGAGLHQRDFVPIAHNEVGRMLQEDGLDDLFSTALACNSVGIKDYLKKDVYFVGGSKHGEHTK